MVSIQLNVLGGVTRLMTDQCTCLLLLLSGLTLLVQIFPSLVSMQSTDLLFSAFMCLLSVSVSPPIITSPILRAQWSSCVFIGRVMAGVAAQRIFVCLFWQTTYLLVIVSSYSLDGPWDAACATAAAAIQTEVVAYVFLILILLGIRAAMESKLKQDIQNRITRNELGAASSLLGIMCDAVVHLDQDLRLMDHSPQLAGLLMRSTGNTSIEGVELSRFMATDEDRQRLLLHLRGGAVTEGFGAGQGQTAGGISFARGTITSAFHADLKDAFGTTIQAEFFSVLFAGLDGKENHLLGLREYTDISPLLPAQVDEPTYADSSENSVETQPRPVMCRPSAIFNAYMEILGSTPEFQQISGCTDDTKLEHLLHPSPAAAATIKRIADEVNAFVHDEGSSDTTRLQFDGGLFRNVLGSTALHVDVDTFELSLFKDDNLGCDYDIGMIVTLQLSSGTPRSNRSRTCEQSSSRRSSRVQRHHKGTGPHLTPGGSFALSCPESSPLSL